MSVYKRGKVYWYTFIRKGKRFQASTRQANRQVALDIESKRKSDLAKGDVGLAEKKPAPLLKDYAQQFIDSVQVHCKEKPKTIEFYAQQLRRLLEFEPLANAPLDKIDEGLIEAFVQYRIRKVSPASVNRALATLRKLLRLARKWKHLDSVPEVTQLPGERIREFVLSYKDEQRYLVAAPQPLRDVAMLILDTGFRLGEALNLQWKDVHFDPLAGAKFGFIHVPRGKSKNAKRNISLTARVRVMLEGRSKNGSEWVFAKPDDVPMLVSSLDHIHAEIREALQFDSEFVLHSLRHTMLTRLGEAGADSFTIMKIAGHSSITISQRYVHPTPEAMERAIERLDSMNQKALTEGQKPQDQPRPSSNSTTVPEEALVGSMG